MIQEPNGGRDGGLCSVGRVHPYVDPCLVCFNILLVPGAPIQRIKRCLFFSKPKSNDPVVKGWLEIGYLGYRYSSDLGRLRSQLEVWGENNPNHPASSMLLEELLESLGAMLNYPNQVALLLPLWLGGGPMWEPMAIAIIFGLLFATVLTLGVVPVLYALLFRVPRPEPD